MDTLGETDSRDSGFRPGDVVDGRYRIERYLDRGGMGEVYLAVDLDLGVRVALKTIRPGSNLDPTALRRFKQEVLLARSVAHPNVCRIYDHGRHRESDVETAFLTMEYLPGETLAARIRSQGQLSREETLHLASQIALALDAAHRAGIVHRDLKCTNVMIVPSDDGERAVVMDFGLALEAEYGRAPSDADTTVDAPSTRAATSARPVESNPSASPESNPEPNPAANPPASPSPSDSLPDDATVTFHGVKSESPGIVGTPAYMSPEQVLGEPVGPASDLYALGVVLFEMVTGRLPFLGASPSETARARLVHAPPSPTDLAEVDERFAKTILRLLEREPEKRFATAGEAVASLVGASEPELASSNLSLPAERDGFVGRENELASLLESLPPATTPGTVLTLVGPGGTGKTRLAVRYGWETQSRWPGGVWFCDLVEARSADGIALAVATSLGVTLRPGDATQQLGNVLKQRESCLVILDNFEQLVDHASATLERWHAIAPAVSFLVTSRERLRVPDESCLELAPLDPTSEGVRLFELRAQSQQPEFSVDEHNRTLVEDIVQRVDGLPLAIELATARLRLLSLEDLHERLRDRFALLAGGKRGRHETLRATLDWSWELLGSTERSALAQISVFEGGFDLSAAESVVEPEKPQDSPMVLDLLQALIDKSWLRTHSALGSIRFSMSPIVQEYVCEKLGEETNAKTATETRHGLHFADLGREPASARSVGDVKRGRVLRLELDNLVAACQRAVERLHRNVTVTSQDAETSVFTFSAAAEVLSLTGPVSVARDLGTRVLTVPTLSPELRARAHQTLGDVLIHLADAEAIRHLETAAAHFRETANRREDACTLTSLGRVYRLRSKYEEARDHFERALAIHVEVGNRSGEASTLGELGILHNDIGENKEALVYYESALDLQRELGNRKMEGAVLNNMTTLAHEQGRPKDAIALANEALAIHRELGDRWFEGILLGNLGLVHDQQGEIEDAHRTFGEAIRIHREVGNRRSEGLTLGNIGNLFFDQGDYEQARRCYEDTLAIHRETGHRRSEGLILGNLAAVSSQLGDEESAQKMCYEALSIHREVGNKRSEATALRALASMHGRAGEFAEAEKHLLAALALDAESGDRAAEASSLGNLAHVHALMGREDEARREFLGSVATLRQINDRIPLAKVQCMQAGFELRSGNVDVARSTIAEADEIATALNLLPESELRTEIEKVREELGG